MGLLLDTTPEHPHKEKALLALKHCDIETKLIYSCRFLQMELLLDTTPEHPHKVNALVAARCATIAEHLQDDSEGLLAARSG